MVGELRAVSTADCGVDICEGQCLRESPRAIYVRFHYPYNGKRQVWVPKSVLCPDSEVYRWSFNPEAKGVQGLLVVKHWWAKKTLLHPHTAEGREGWDESRLSWREGGPKTQLPESQMKLFPQ